MSLTQAIRNAGKHLIVVPNLEAAGGEVEPVAKGGAVGRQGGVEGGVPHEVPPVRPLELGRATAVHACHSVGVGQADPEVLVTIVQS